MNINTMNINNLRMAFGLKEFKELPAIAYPESIGESCMDVLFNDEDSKDHIYSMISDNQYGYIALYPTYIRFFPKNIFNPVN